MTRKPLLVLAWLCALLMLVGRPAAAAPSPAGIVNDESGTFSAQQLADLDQALSGLTYPFQVIVVNTAFPGGRPSDAETQFQAFADRLLQERIPKDAVLITVSMQDRLIDFRVWSDGPVNQAFLAKTGREFGSHSGAMLDAYRVPARAGDIPGGIIAAARVVEGVLATAQSPAPISTPGSGSYPSPAPNPVPSDHIFNQPPPMPDPVPQAPPANPWPWVGGIALLGTAAYWTVAFRRYRLALREALELRDGFLGELLELMERDLPLARKYQGEETLSSVSAASNAADAALHAEQEAEALRLGAERFAKFQQFARATAALREATTAYQRAEALSQEAQKTWEPVVDALLNWEKDQADVGNRLAATGAALSAEKVRTGWPLTDLGARLSREEAQLTLARSNRDNDPVRAVRLAREAGATAETLAGDLGALRGLTQALEEQRQRRAAAEASVETARRELGLRFVELPPEPSLAWTLEAEQDAASALPPGEVARVRESLAAARAASDEAEAIVARYREALKQYPEKSAALSGELAVLPGEERLAADTLGDLRARFAAEDWEDVRTVADDLARLQAEARGALSEVARLTSPAVQLYLQAVTLLDEMLARRKALGEALTVLTARPGALEALAAEARSNLDAQDRSLAEADEVALSNRLILPRDVAAQLDDARRTYHLAEQQGHEVPLAVHRWARAAADGAAVAAAALDAVREVARLAAAARAELARAQSEANSALGYERYDRRGHAMTLRGSLVAAESALATGHYQAALAEAGQAMNAARGLEMAYREYVAAQMEAERRRREAEEASRRASESHHNSSSSSSSGGGGSWSSGSSSNNSSGGGGSW